MTSSRRPALRIAALFFAVGVLWIVLSDLVLTSLIGEATQRAAVQVAKGAFFVLASSGLIYLLLSHELRRRREVEEALRRIGQRLGAVIEASPVAIISLDAQGLITLWSAAAERMFGRTEAEVLGSGVACISEQHQPAFDALLREVLQGGTVTNREVAHRRRDGSPMDISVSAAPLRGPTGDIEGLTAVIADLSEHKRLEAELRQAQKMEAIGRLAGAIGHDFNNLLTGIGGYTDLALETLPGGSPVREDILQIRRAADSATALTRQLLTFSRRESTAPRALDLNERLQELSGMMGLLAGERIELVTRLDHALWQVRCDPSQVEQVIMNLAVNARDAMPQGGRLTIETKNIALDAVDIRALPDTPAGDYVVVSVSDTGVGMSAEIRSRIFEPFFTTKEDGTGLGLSTVYGIVKQHGGAVSVDSEVGRGTTFRVYLPRSEGEPVDVPARAPLRENGAGGGEIVLVAEDSDEVRRFVDRVLSRIGYQVLSAPTGEEALRLADERRDIDLLITDVVLPRITGPELAERLVASHPGLRVLYTSGYSAAVVSRDLGAGALFLEKPFAPTELTSCVRRALDLQGA